MDFDINAVDQIIVNYSNGEEYIYRGRGLEKFRKMVNASIPYGATKKNKATKVNVVEEDDVEDGSSSATQVIVERKQSAGTGGYNTVSLDYKKNNSGVGSAIDAAKELQRQAEKSSGLRF